MRNRKNKGFPKAIIFVIFLIIVTVFSWKGCSDSNSRSEIGYNGNEQVYLTVHLDK